MHGVFLQREPKDNPESTYAACCVDVQHSVSSILILQLVGFWLFFQLLLSTVKAHFPTTELYIHTSQSNFYSSGGKFFCKCGPAKLNEYRGNIAPTLYSQLVLTYSQKCCIFFSLAVISLTFSLRHFVTFPTSLSLSLYQGQYWYANAPPIQGAHRLDYGP